ncbi:MAG: AAA family ATPase [Anaerolineae bacterium]|nr:ATP-binding protein [Candidatus Roseilinea sp.]MDW8450827.1 AAA family ATPase [Anaerolineae bacterium]
MVPNRLQLRNFGPVKSADLSFGALTVFVGPQATGKSLTLQLVKLLADTGAIHNTLRQYGVDWDSGNPPAFVSTVFGEGMQGIWGKDTLVESDGQSIDLQSLARRGKRNLTEHVFFIPAQRVLAINPQSGWFRGFYDYRLGDPFVVRDFGEKLRRLAERELLGENRIVFPQSRRLKKVIRDALLEAIFGGFSLRIEAQLGQRRLVLQPNEGDSLPFTVWSAGQREFVPLLLGAYQLLPPSKTPRRESLELAVIEEVEMGLHPQAISAAMLLVLDLLQRGYRVYLSTHSPHVLDVIWALRRFRESRADEQFVRSLFNLPANSEARKLAEAALDPAKELKVYYFERERGIVQDISNLDPASENASESGWGGLTEFSGHVGNLVAQAVTNGKVFP